ncbi:hypothetical protein KP509_35G062300 [Ceratopteris richardii]|uniref:Uncharacterized protein n=1 Tax=Ceratopteris richardii TaxID=49495 RepID=A0A8T2QHV9_CERRI|nr:hypothetical protein KP509_35G062300 [Ceratopteris richardii]
MDQAGCLGGGMSKTLQTLMFTFSIRVNTIWTIVMKLTVSKLRRGTKLVHILVLIKVPNNGDRRFGGRSRQEREREHRWITDHRALLSEETERETQRVRSRQVVTRRERFGRAATCL